MGRYVFESDRERHAKYPVIITILAQPAANVWELQIVYDLYAGCIISKDQKSPLGQNFVIFLMRLFCVKFPINQENKFWTFGTNCK